MKTIFVFIFSAAFLTVLTSSQSLHCSCWNLTFIRSHFSLCYQLDWCRPPRLPSLPLISWMFFQPAEAQASRVWPCSGYTSQNTLSWSEEKICILLNKIVFCIYLFISVIIGGLLSSALFGLTSDLTAFNVSTKMKLEVIRRHKLLYYSKIRW